MSKLQWLAGVGLLALAGLVLVGSAAPADDAKKTDETKKAEGPPKLNPAGIDVKNIALAYELAEYGRKNKNPEMLVSAARILRRIKPTAGKGDPKIEAPRGEEVKEDKVPELVSLTDQSKALLEEAKKMAPDDAVVGELIERVNKDTTTRGSLGGPRAFTRFIRPGGVHAWGVNFVGHVPATVSVTGNGVTIFTIQAINDQGIVVVSSTGTYPSLCWAPAFTRHFTLRVRNDGPVPCTYTLYHN
jgi:hypothetical protein